MHQAVILSEDESVGKTLQAYLESHHIKVWALTESELSDLADRPSDELGDQSKTESVFFVIPSLNPQSYSLANLPCALSKRNMAVNAACTLRCERYIDVGCGIEEEYRQITEQESSLSSIVRNSLLSEPPMKGWIAMGATLLAAYETTALLTYQRRLNYLHTQVGFVWKSQLMNAQNLDQIKEMSNVSILQNEPIAIDELVERLYLMTVNCRKRGNYYLGNITTQFLSSVDA